MRHALEVMKYINNHGDEFVQPFAGWVFALINFWVTFSIEICSQAKMCSQTTFVNTLTFFFVYLALNAVPDFSWAVF
jgi:hypothetical protein